MTAPRPIALVVVVALAVSLAAAPKTSSAQGSSAVAAPSVLDQPPATTAGPHASASPQVIAARRAMRQACAGDIKTFCADVAAGRGGVMRCLRTHATQLSPGCASAGRSLRDARRAAG